MRHLLIRFIINAIALFAATQVGIPGLHFEGNWMTLVFVAFIFGVVNAVVRPLLTFLTCPLVVLTLGLFIFVVNALMLALTGWISGQLGLGFTIDGFAAAFVGALVVTVVSWVLSVLIRDEHERRH